MKILLCISSIIFIVSCSSTSKKSTTYGGLYKKASFINRTHERYPSKHYKYLIKKYTKENYGKSAIYMRSPQVLVIHSTATATLETALNVFNSDTLHGRDDIELGGRVNVSIHFIIDRNGTIYSFTPLPFITRHVIGLNYTAIGIENIGFPNDLTKKQLDANIKLINYLTDNIKSIKYIIGHFESNNENLKHYSLIKTKDNNYKTKKRYDPSFEFLETVRNNIKIYKN